MKRLVFFVLLVFVGAVLFAAPTSEKKFPDSERPITIVVPHAAGGGTDLIFRALAEEMKAISKHNFLVTNVVGAGSATGANEVLRAEADGYTMLGAGTHTTAATMQGLTEGYKQLDYVAGLNWDPFIIGVKNDAPWKNMQDLVKDGKSRAGVISLGNAGMGGATGVAGVGLNLAFNKAFNIVPFNGGAELIASVRGGHCDVGIFSQSEVQVNKEALRALAILGDSRSTIADLASTPTMAEAGFPGLNVPNGSFRSLMAKTGTPKAAMQWLADVAEKAFNSAGFQNFMKTNGIIPAFSKLENFRKYDAKIIGEYEVILKEAGLYKMK